MSSKSVWTWKKGKGALWKNRTVPESSEPSDSMTDDIAAAALVEATAAASGAANLHNAGETLENGKER